MQGQPSDAGVRCPECGSGVPDGASFCRVCGQRLASRRGVITQKTVVLASVYDPATEPATAQVLRARRGVRFSSSTLDVAVMASPALPLSVVAAMVGRAELIYVVMPVAVVSVWLWMQIWQGLTGSSFGKSMLGLRLVGLADNGPAGLARAILRSGFFVATFGLAAVPVIRSSEPQLGLHDRISGTQVLDISTADVPVRKQQRITLRRSGSVRPDDLPAVPGRL